MQTEMFAELIKQRDFKQREIEHQSNKIERHKEQIKGIERQIVIEKRRIDEMTAMIDALRESGFSVQSTEGKERKA